MQNENNVVIVFKIEKCVEELIGYRKISFDVIWWSYSGNKIPNNAIQYEKKGENKVAYVTINGINLTKEDSQKQL